MPQYGSGGSQTRRDPSTTPGSRSIVPVITGKLVPPELPAATIPRDRLLRQIADETRLLCIVAPAGFGKSIAARQIADADQRPLAWLTIDLLDDSPTTFWLHLIHSLRWAEPCIGAEPEQLLEQCGPQDPAFLVMLISQLERAGTPAVLVLDGVARLTDRSALDGLALLVERVGDLVRFVMVGRGFPDLPIGHWRAHGWVRELGANDLRFTTSEATAAIAALTGSAVDADLAERVNDRVEGWPTGVVLAAQSLVGTARPEEAFDRLSGSDRLFSEYFSSEILDRLSAEQRAVARSVAVLDEFDSEICLELLGRDAVSLAQGLLRVHGFLADHDAATGRLRMHPMLREMLEEELRRSDPDHHRALHQRAAALFSKRRDLSRAHRHLLRIGDETAAADLVISPVLALVNRGDRRGLATLKRLFPREMATTDASFAFDVASAWLFIGNLAEADYWGDRGEQLMVNHSPAMQQRLFSVRAMIALLRGEVGAGQRHVAAFELADHPGNVGPLEDRFATTAARLMLAAGRLDEATIWLERAAQIAQPAVITDVNVPALQAWLALERGRLRRASELAEAACSRADELGIRPHHGSSDALIVSGWCRLAVGDIAGAKVRADAAAADAEVLVVPWNRIRAAVLAAEVRRLGGAPRAAFAVLRDLRTDLGAGGEARPSDVTHLFDEVVAEEARCLIDLGDLEAAGTRIGTLGAGQIRRMLTARLALRQGAGIGVIAETLGDRESWSPQQQMEADVLLVAAEGITEQSRERLATTVQEGSTLGWVSPFLGHGADIDGALLGLTMGTLHPTLGWALSAVSTGPVVASSAHDRLTPRELRLLSLLPTHLSYAEIGERLFISVNTVKTNLKTLYRKLGATTRAEAVELSKTAGLAIQSDDGMAKADPSAVPPLR